MKEHTIALLTECEAGLKMATGSMEQTLPKLSDPGFKPCFRIIIPSTQNYRRSAKDS